MAKVGEGDPRWIVSERQDGANVNAWHWEERDLSKYAHEELTKRFANLSVTEFNADSTGVSSLTIDEISDISGDVTVAQRKGKMMCYFELKLTLKWSGSSTSAPDSVIKGKMEVPEVDHDELRNDYDIIVSCQESTPVAQKVEAVVRSAGRAAVRRVIIEFFEKVFSEYHIGKVVKDGTVMPPMPQTRGQVAGASAAAASSSPTQAQPTGTASASAKGASDASVWEGEATNFSWKMRWGAPIEELFVCLTSEQRAAVYTRSPAKVDAQAGGQFSFLNGVITGYYVDVQGPTLLKMQWRLKSWPVGVHSSVVMQLTREEPGVTVMEFAQSGIPAGQMQSVREGWRANFFDAMKMVFGFTLDYL